MTSPSQEQDKFLEDLCLGKTAGPIAEEEYSELDKIWCRLSLVLGQSVKDFTARAPDRALEDLDVDAEFDKILDAGVNLLDNIEFEKTYGAQKFEDVVTTYSIMVRGALGGVLVALRTRAADARPTSVKRKRSPKLPEPTFTVNIDPEHAKPRSPSYCPRKLRRTDSRVVSSNPETGLPSVTLNARGGS